MSWAPMALDFPIPPDADPLFLTETLLFSSLFPSSFGLSVSTLNLPVKRDKTNGGQGR